jgi:hypothetical protein
MRRALHPLSRAGSLFARRREAPAAVEAPADQAANEDG